MGSDIQVFLREKGMHWDSIDMMRETAAFRRQMEDGLAGRPSSLMMIPAFITVEHPPTAGEEVIVVDAGGTNLRVATVGMEREAGAFVSNFRKMSMPGTRGRLDIGKFFEAIADALEPVLHVSEKVGFCFSFPCEILPSGDGRILGFNKEVEIDGAPGRLLGEGVNRALRARGREEKRFVVLNDTVACMLGGIAAGGAERYESYIGYILGTGTNTCYLEDCGRIVKSPEARARSGPMAVNMESGGYGGCPQGRYDKELDDASNNPGDHRLEKMISGAYQGALIHRTVRGAVEAGLFSPEFARRFAEMDGFNMRQVDDFCAAPEGGSALAVLAADSGEDRAGLMEIIGANVERAARATAVCFGAILTHTGMGRTPQRPVCVMAEGTSFKKSVLFGGKLRGYIRDFLGGELGVHCDVISGEDVTLTGTAVAALMLDP